MKRFILFALFLLAQAGSIQALDVQGRAAYFYPVDNRIRDIYSSKGFAEYEFEVSSPIDACGCEYADWDYFANVSYYQKRGRSISCLESLRSRTEVTNWALNMGVKRYFDMSCYCQQNFRPYLGAGTGFAHVAFHDKSDFVRRHMDEWGFSVLFKSGIKYDITCNFYLDLFMDYSYHWFSFCQCNSCCVENRNPNTGGLKLGLGLGYQF